MKGAPKQRLRPIAVVVARRGNDLLVQRGTDPDTGEPFHRLVGGGIEFGETAAEAVARELDEELGARLADIRLLAWLENLFEFGGAQGHELVAVLQASIVSPHLLERDDLGEIPGTDSTVHWVPAAELLGGTVPLYPEALVPLLSDLLAAG